MGYRIFVDTEGVEWQAWDVMPKAVERRFANRRVAREGVGFPDRRRSTERRQVNGRWSPLTSGLRDGWLCFDAEGMRRRLTPIPGDWEDCDYGALEAYCRSAIPVRVSSSFPRRA
jgi:hypothetical protein